MCRLSSKQLKTQPIRRLVQTLPNQNYYSLVRRGYESELVSLGLDRGVGAIVWSPLGWGHLIGKIWRDQPLPAGSRLHKPADLGPQVPEEYLYTVVDALDQAAQKTGETVPQIALD